MLQEHFKEILRHDGKCARYINVNKNLTFLFKVYIMKDIPLIRDAQLFPNILLFCVFTGISPFVNAATVT